MSLGKDILFYFHSNNITTTTNLGSFIDMQLPNYIAVDIQFAINQLCLNSYLVPTGVSWDYNIRNNTYQTMIYNQKDADYGVYDFVIYGTSKIYDTFKSSVLPIIINTSGDIQIGTSFIVNYNDNICLITARHCIDIKESEIFIYNSNDKPIIPKRIVVPEKSEFVGDDGFEFQNLDVCVLCFDKDVFKDDKSFILEEPKVLSDILVLGYPPTGLFDKASDVNNAVLIAEKASIAHKYIKATTGQNVGSGTLPLTKLDYVLISARVKGGNSGGPVINEHGKVVGIITQIPMDGTSSASEKVDDLGFGFACSSLLLEKFLSSIFDSSKEIKIKELDFKVNTESFTV